MHNNSGSLCSLPMRGEPANYPSPGVLKLFWLEEPLATFNKSQDISSAPPSNIKDVVVIVNIKKKTNAAFAVWPHSTVRRGATYVSQTEYE